MPAYEDVHFDPPAPVAWVTLQNPVNGRSVSNVPMLLDTGADVTLLPKSSVELLGIQPQFQEGFHLVAFDGTRSLSQAAFAHLILLKMTFRGRYLLLDDATGVMGRDILNHLTVRLDGRNLSWDLETS